MMSRNQLYVAAIVITVLFASSGLIMGSANHFAFASPTTATNQTGNQTGANMTTTAGGGDQGAAKMHLGEAIKALQAGDTAGAKMHAQVAQDGL